MKQGAGAVLRQLNTLRALLALPSKDPGLARSQLEAFSKQIPILYGILIANTMLLAATHRTVRRACSPSSYHRSPARPARPGS